MITQERAKECLRFMDEYLDANFVSNGAGFYPDPAWDETRKAALKKFPEAKPYLTEWEISDRLLIIAGDEKTLKAREVANKK